MDLDHLSAKGHFTKVFDPTRKIPKADFDRLMDFLYSIPQSVNAQAAHYLIAESLDARTRIVNVMGEGFRQFNGPKILAASHLIVFATRHDLTDEYLDEVHAKEIADGKFPNQAIQKQWYDVVRGAINSHRYDTKDLFHWMEKQAYLGVGMMLMAAEELGINAIPMEGFDSKLVDAELGLRAKGMTTTLLLVLGYRVAEGDFYLPTPKSRLPRERSFTFLDR